MLVAWLGARARVSDEQCALHGRTLLIARGRVGVIESFDASRLFATMTRQDAGYSASSARVVVGRRRLGTVPQR